MKSGEQVGSAARLTAFGVLCGMTWLLGLLARSSLAISLGQALLLMGMLSYLAARASLLKLRVRRECAFGLTEQDPVSVELLVSNDGWLPGYLVEVTDWFSPDQAPRKPNLLLALAPRATDVPLRYDAVCGAGRGVYQLSAVELATSDPLGLFRARRVMAVEQEVVVYPRPLPALPLELRSLARGDLASRAQVSRIGQTNNPLGTREYRGGAPVRHIHWRASARRGELVIREYEAGAGLHLSVFLDLASDSLRGEGRFSNVEWAIRLAATLGSALDDESMLQLIADDGCPVVLPARSGRRQYLALLELLARLRVTGQTPFVELLDRGAQLVPEGATLVAIFSHPTPDLSRLDQLCARWRQREITAVALLLDGPFGSPEALEQTRVSLERLGIRVVTIPCEAA